MALAELEELLEAVHAKSIGDIDPQLVRGSELQKGLGWILGIPWATRVKDEGLSEVAQE